jgi:hypothetical protein
MFPVATKGGGNCFAFPDVCNVPAPPAPPIPTPFPNTAQLQQAIPPTCAQKVLIQNQPVATMKTKIPMTSGDEAGSLGGIMSGMIKGPARFTKGSTKVKAEGQPVIFQTCMSAHNGVNANAPMGVQTTPSQNKVKLAM